MGFALAIEAYAPPQLAMLITGSSSTYLNRAQSLSDGIVELTSLHEEEHIGNEKTMKAEKRAASGSR